MIDATNEDAYGERVATRKGTWGGWRPGSGRKPVLRDRVRFLVDLEQDQLDWLRRTAAEESTSVSGLIRGLIAARMKRRGRKG